MPQQTTVVREIVGSLSTSTSFSFSIFCSSSFSTSFSIFPSRTERPIYEDKADNEIEIEKEDEDEDD